VVYIWICFVSLSFSHTFLKVFLSYWVFFFCLRVKVYIVICKFLSPNWVKINIDEALRGILVVLLVEVFSVRVWRSLLAFSVRFLKFRLVWLLSFMELYMLWRKLKRWSLLMSDLNVILHWFVLRFLLGLMFHGCFVIDGILVLITVRKSGLWLLIFFVKKMYVLISWLIYVIHREPFHWYIRLPSSMFLKFFMNRYSLSMYRFC